MNDLKFAFRQLLKNPGFTAVAVLTLALGMGLSVSMFSIFNSAALRPLPGVKNPEEVVYASKPAQIGHGQFEYLRDHSKSFSGLAASSGEGFELETDDPAKADSARQKILMQVVEGDYFGVLGADAPLGRYFLPEEFGAANGSLVVVLSHRFWQQHFNADPRVLGQTIQLNGQAFNIVGIAPESFPGREPSFKFMEPSRNGVDDSPDAWSPLLAPSRMIRLSRANYDFRLIGRLKPGVSPKQAEMELEVLDAQFAELSSRKKKDPGEVQRVVLEKGFTRIPLSVFKDRDGMQTLGSLAVILGLVLLIACANVANLQLARAAERRKEIGIRQALGAGRARLVRQFLTESVLLAVLGGLAATLTGLWMSNLVRSFAAQLFPEFRHYIESLDFGLDLHVLGYAMALSAASGVIFGLAPALEFSRTNLSPALKEEGSALAGLSRSGLRNALIIGQVAVSLALLIVAGLVTRTTLAASNREFAFANRNVLMVEMYLPYDVARARAFHREVQERLAALLGIEAVGLTSVPNLGERRTTIAIEGRPAETFSHLGPSSWGQNYFYTPGYFETLQIPIVQGRGFTEDDIRQDEPVVVISQQMARHYWPGGSPVGKRFTLGTNSTLWEIVGVARDGMSKEVMKAVPGISFHYSSVFAGDLYLPLRPDTPHPQSMTLMVRVAGNPKAMIPQVTREIRRLDRNLEVSAQVLRDVMDVSLAPVVASGFFTAGLGLLALVLATMGIYGAMAYVVSRRTHEIGVRMAMGAKKGDVLRMIVLQGMRLVLLGVAIGLIAAMGMARILASVVGNLNPLDPVSFLGVSFLSLLAALLACWLPARRAAKVDPMVALRTE